ncbi:P-loop containing nucleoside triphosphate hydrolase protein [Dioscorea alata]|uniref:P-loop containing nucleoside triphosphate hydrolase protein n=1 Tax=Dioscorea alata TaxID=55571 RepID=A0ACB7VXU7_DIOAL|nr:P-loop containing nucleoside triphosphate hydrolase protein [Dioscorea alata]
MWFHFVLQSGPDERSIPGNTIALQADMLYSGLTTFGTAFCVKISMFSDAASSMLTFFAFMRKFAHNNLIYLLKLICIYFLNLLEHITFIDTPGVLPGEKQQTQCSYDFTGATSRFAAKCDLILLLFDPHKLGIGEMSSNMLLDLFVEMMIKSLLFLIRQTKLTLSS